jgi:hypothetical protein
VNGEVNRQNLRYWLKDSPHWFFRSKQQTAERIMMCCCIWDTNVSGPFGFTGTLTERSHLHMSWDKLMPELVISLKGNQNVSCKAGFCHAMHSQFITG